VFLDAFVNGGLLGPGGQAELDSSLVPAPDFGTPFVSLPVGFALTKLVNTGVPGFPDSQVFFHSGSLPGVECFNAVVREHDSERTLAVGAICQNGHGSGQPSISWISGSSS